MTPIPAFARVQTMTPDDKRARIDEITAQEHTLIREKVSLQLEIEIEEGRPDSYRARWARAWLAGDMPECDRLLAEEFPKVEV